MVTALLVQGKREDRSRGGWFVSVESNYKISVGRIPIELGGRSQKKVRTDDQDGDWP